MLPFFRISFLLLLVIIHSHVKATCLPIEVITPGFGSIHGNNNLPSQAVAGLRMQCEDEYRLGLEGGQQPLAGTRRLSDGAGHFIVYSLWQDQAAQVAWGDNGFVSNNPSPVASLMMPNTRNSMNHPVYGTALTAGATPPGLYHDRVRVTLVYPPYGPGDQQEADLFLTLNLMGTCSLDTNGIKGFGSWPATRSNLQGVALGVITVKCTVGLNYAVGINAGLHWQNGYRHLNNDTALI